MTASGPGSTPVCGNPHYFFLPASPKTRLNNPDLGSSAARASTGALGFNFD